MIAPVRHGACAHATAAQAAVGRVPHTGAGGSMPSCWYMAMKS